MKIPNHIIFPSMVRVFGTLSVFLLTTFLARKYGAYQSGEFFYVIGLVAILSQIVRLGVDHFIVSTVFDGQNGRADLDKIVFSAFVMISVNALALNFLLFISSGFHHSLPQITGAYLVGSLISFSMLWVIASYARVNGFPSWAIFLESMVLSLTALILLFVVRPHEISTITAHYSILLTSLISVLIFTYISKKTGSKIENPVSLESIIDIYRYSYKYTSVSLINALIIWGPLVGLGLLGQMEEAGIYNAFLRISMIIGASLSVYKGVMLKEARLGKKVNITVTTELRMITPLIVLVIVGFLARDRIMQLLGKEFSTYSELMVVMLIIQAMNVYGAIFETRAVMAKETSILKKNSILTFLLSMFSIPILVSQFGLQGAVLSIGVIVFLARLHLILSYMSNIKQKESVNVFL